MLICILFGLAVLLAAFLFAASRQPDDLRVVRSIAIAAPAEIAFAQVNDLRRWPMRDVPLCEA